MWLLLIIILSMIAGSFLTLLAIWVAAVCIEKDRKPFEHIPARSLQYPSELTGRRLFD